MPRQNEETNTNDAQTRKNRSESDRDASSNTPDHTPGTAEGDEKTVDEALRNSEQ